MDHDLTRGASSRPGGGKHLNFWLGQEAFSLPILKVREIIRLQSITPVPRMPRCVKGVINLRGKIVPVMDLRERLELPSVDYDEHSCIVILQANETGHLGLIVDRVEDVAQINESDIESPPGLGLGSRGEFMIGIANTRDGVRMILNARRLVDLDSLMNLFDDPL